MPDFGIVPAGFLLKTVQDCLQETNDLQTSEIDAGLDVSPPAPDGQRNAIAARQQGAVWELEATLYEMLDPDKAEDALLISLCKLSGTVPQSTTPTIVVAVVNVEAGTELNAGQQFANLAGKPDVRFTPAVDFVAGAAGNYTITFLSEFAGPVSCPAGQMTQISSGPTVGTWNTVSNALDGVLGLPADTNTTLRLRRLSELAAAGSSSVPALETDMLQAKNAAGDPLVTYCRVFENATSVFDSDGRPPNSIEILCTPSGSNATGELASFIWARTGGGPTRFGLNSDSFTDTTGEVRVMNFTIPVNSLIYVAFTIKVEGTFAGATAFEIAAALVLNAGAKPGADFALLWDAEKAAAFPGVVNLVSVKQGIARAPTGTADISIGSRGLATYDSTRITVTLV